MVSLSPNSVEYIFKCAIYYCCFKIVTKLIQPALIKLFPKIRSILSIRMAIGTIFVTTIAASILGGITVNQNLLKFPMQKATCYMRECCHPNDGTGYIRYERGVEQLMKDLNQKVYGQPLIVKPIYRALRAHMANEHPTRPLLMYFSGWTGTGKTHVARLIASNLYKEGMKSNYVKYISSSYHFPTKIESDSQINIQRNRLREMITSTVSKCGRSLIILDELDKLPSGVVDALQPLVDYVEEVDGISYNKAIFIFLSNTGAENLNTLAYKLFTEGKSRKDISSKDVQEILTKDGFNEEGGLRNSSILKKHSIGVFVPFLPLERQHVELCIRDEIVNQQVIADNQDKLIDSIADEMLYYPEEAQLYSKSGCKGVHDRVINYAGPELEQEDDSIRNEL